MITNIITCRTVKVNFIKLFYVKELQNQRKYGIYIFYILDLRIERSCSKIFISETMLTIQKINEFYYKLLNNIVPCGVTLSKWKNDTSQLRMCLLYEKLNDLTYVI